MCSEYTCRCVSVSGESMCLHGEYGLCMVSQRVCIVTQRVCVVSQCLCAVSVSGESVSTW